MYVKASHFLLYNFAKIVLTIKFFITLSMLKRSNNCDMTKYLIPVMEQFFIVPCDFYKISDFSDIYGKIYLNRVNCLMKLMYYNYFAYHKHTGYMANT